MNKLSDSLVVSTFDAYCGSVDVKNINEVAVAVVNHNQRVKDYVMHHEAVFAG